MAGKFSSRAQMLAGAVVLAVAAPAAALAQAPLNVLATIGMIADVAQNVGGACVEVSTLIGPGADPHLYQATASDVTALQRADIILYAGFGLEGQLGDVLARLGENKPTLAVAPASIGPDNLIAVQDMYGIDPHLWMDPSLWAGIVPTIADVLVELRPDCAEAIAANAASYGEQLAALHDWAAASIASIPEQARVLVTAHDAFGYYARAYGIEEVAVQGLSTESEASIADIRDVAEAVHASGVPAVFVETTINPRTIEAMIEAVRSLGGEVTIGGELYSDAMGDEGTPGGTYIGMIHGNTVTITEALGGTPPPLPAALSDWAAEWGLGD